jgi:exosortase/archaeosortase family protein
MKKLKQLINSFLKKYKLEPYKDLILFVLIILAMHIPWKIFARVYEYEIFGFEPLSGIFNFLILHLTTVSAWIMEHIFNLDNWVEQGQGILFPDAEKCCWINYGDNVRLGIDEGCTALKQFYHFLGLMLIIPGPWKKKAWFIPLGLLILHITNFFRIIGLGLVVYYKYEWFDFTHDWVFRPLFYVVMLALWIWWVEKLAKN